jgi:hypothetical protein
MSNYTPLSPESNGDPPLTPLEMAIESRHGDLHQVIPALTVNRSFAEVAQMIQVSPNRPSEGWVRKWLKRHGYVRLCRYVTPAELEAATS